jgi:hypothetical protein
MSSIRNRAFLAGVAGWPDGTAVPSDKWYICDTYYLYVFIASIHRTYTVTAENRICVVTAENRVLVTS